MSELRHRQAFSDVQWIPFSYASNVLQSNANSHVLVSASATLAIDIECEQVAATNGTCIIMENLDIELQRSIRPLTSDNIIQAADVVIG